MALLKKERTLLFRDKRGIISTLFFTALVSLILFFGLGYFDFDKVLVVPNTVWLATLFGGTLQLNRTFDYEREESVMEGLKMIPGIAGRIYLSKFIINVLIISLLILFATLFTSLLFNYSGGFGFLLPVFLGSVCISAVGTTFSSMFMGHHKKDIMLPTLFYPLVAPIVVAVIKASSITTPDTAPWLKLIIAFIIIYVTVSYLVFESILGE